MNFLTKLILSFTAVTTLCIASSTPARAASLVFTNRAAFNAAATGLTTLTFEGIAPVGSVANFSTPLVLAGASFNGATSGSPVISVVDSGFFAPLFQFNSGAVLSGFSFVEVTLPAGITALATDVMSTNPTGNAFDVVLSTGEVFTVTTPLRPERGFFGITSDVAITSIRFTTAAGQQRGIPLIDNFSFGQAAVPEPATLTLLGVGLAGIVGGLRRRRNIG